MRRLVTTLALVVPIAAASPASAKVFDLYAQIEGGASSGTGLAGEKQGSDFFGNATGGLYGAKLGGEVLFTDFWVEHWQLTDGGIIGTWTQFMAGTDVDFALGEAKQGEKQKTFAELGFAFGFGLGTGQQVMPPLDNGQLSDKGFIAQISLGVDYRLNSVMSIGLVVPITYGYLFKANLPANDTATQYQAIGAQPQLYLRLHLGK